MLPMRNLLDAHAMLFEIDDLNASRVIWRQSRLISPSQISHGVLTQDVSYRTFFFVNVIPQIIPSSERTKPNAHAERNPASSTLKSLLQSLQAGT